MSIIRDTYSLHRKIFNCHTKCRAVQFAVALVVAIGIWQIFTAMPVGAMFKDRFLDTTTSSPTTFTVPFDGVYQIETWGARGGATFLQTNCSGGVIDGGWGAYTRGRITLTKGLNLYAYRGGKGANGGCAGTGAPSGGAIGGGAGGAAYQRGGGGGGGSDVRLTGGAWNGSGSLASRIMVAGGGAGASNWDNSATGAYGGTLTGGGGVLNAGSAAHCLATGGSQTAGGRGGGGATNCTATNGNPGSFGIGGAAESSAGHGSGGGGGYYGGGGGGIIGGGVSTGGGGSSYVSGCSGCNSVTSATNLTPSGSATHYSGRSFSNISMIAGNGTRPNSVGYSTWAHEYGGVRITLVSYGSSVASAANEFRCTGAAQTYTAPVTGVYKLEVWGAQGAGQLDGAIGKGAYAMGFYSAARNLAMNVYVGCAGGFGTSVPLAGGWNGGGSVTAAYSDGNNGTGGGATDIRIGGTALSNRRIVAGGGGGSVAQNTTAQGHGGAATGITGQFSGQTANGGTQTAGGTATDGSTAQTGAAIGSLGQGGNNSRAGGGGGYYGGGAAPYVGGGGSSYVGGVVAWSGTSTTRIAGNASMPDPMSTTGGTMTGNLGDGYARINLMSVNMTATSISPNTVDVGKTQLVTITGTNFAEGSPLTLTGGAITVTIGGVACTGVSVTSATRLTCTAPSRATAGAVNVVVSNALGDSSTLTNAYTYRDFLYLSTSGNVALSSSPTVNGGFSQGSATVSVQTNSSTGYTLSVRTPTNTSLTCAANPSRSFSALAADGVLGNGQWGWNVGSAPGFVGTWRAIKTTDVNSGGGANDGLITKKTSASGPSGNGAAADSYSVWFGVKADYSIPSCGYQTTIMYTAMTN